MGAVNTEPVSPVLQASRPAAVASWGTPKFAGQISLRDAVRRFGLWEAIVLGLGLHMTVAKTVAEIVAEIVAGAVLPEEGRHWPHAYASG